VFTLLLLSVTSRVPTTKMASIRDIAVLQFSGSLKKKRSQNSTRHYRQYCRQRSQRKLALAALIVLFSATLSSLLRAEREAWTLPR